MKTSTKNAQMQVGLAIIAMAILLFVGGIFLNDGQTTGTKYKDSGYIGSNNTNCEDCIFYINETTIGKQVKETENTPNIQLGSEVEYTTLYAGNSFRLTGNMFTANQRTIRVSTEKPQDVRELLLYFTPERYAGDNELLVYINGKLVEQTPARAAQLPISIPIQMRNTSIYVTLALVKPAWYELFNWNKMDINDFKVVAKTQDSQNGKKDFNFQVDKAYLEKMYIDLLISCKDQTKQFGPAIEVKVNDYIITNTNPDCTLTNKRITAEVPINILKDDKNTLTLSTPGHYTLAYSINKVYFNDQLKYTFTLSNFEDVLDLTMYGDFNPEMLDFKLNGHLLSLHRDDMMPVLDYVKLGKNEIQILTNPIEIKELRIEKDVWK